MPNLTAHVRQGTPLLRVAKARIVLMTAVCSGTGQAAHANPNANWSSESGNPLPGVDGTVNDAICYQRDLYITGECFSVGGVAANNVAKWNGTPCPLGRAGRRESWPSWICQLRTGRERRVGWCSPLQMGSGPRPRAQNAHRWTSSTRRAGETAPDPIARRCTSGAADRPCDVRPDSAGQRG